MNIINHCYKSSVWKFVITCSGVLSPLSINVSSSEQHTSFWVDMQQIVLMKQQHSDSLVLSSSTKDITFDIKIVESNTIFYHKQVEHLQIFWKWFLWINFLIIRSSNLMMPCVTSIKCCGCISTVIISSRNQMRHQTYSKGLRLRFSWSTISTWR